MKSSSVLLSRSFHSLVTNTETQYKYNKNAYITIYFRWQQVVLIVGHLSRINAYHTDRTSHEESQKTFQVCPYPGFLRALLQLSSPLERFCLRNYLQNIVWHSILFPLFSLEPLHLRHLCFLYPQSRKAETVASLQEIQPISTFYSNYCHCARFCQWDAVLFLKMVCLRVLIETPKMTPTTMAPAIKHTLPGGLAGAPLPVL